MLFHPKYDLEGIRSFAQPDPRFLALKKRYSRKIIALTDGSMLEKLSSIRRSGNVSPKIFNLLWWGDLHHKPLPTLIEAVSRDKNNNTKKKSRNSPRERFLVGCSSLLLDVKLVEHLMALRA